MPQVAAVAITAGIAAEEANRARQQQQPYISAMTDAAKTQAGVAAKTAPYAAGFYQRAQEAYDPAAAYYKAAAAGGPSLVASQAYPLSLVGQKYGSIMSATRNLQPRSGASPYDTEFRAGDEKQAILGSARESAVGNLVRLAGDAGQIGSGAAGASRGAAATGITGLDASLGAERNLASDRAGALSQFQITPEQQGALSQWANGKRTGGGGASGGAGGTSWIPSSDGGAPTLGTM